MDVVVFRTSDTAHENSDAGPFVAERTALVDFLRRVCVERVGPDVPFECNFIYAGTHTSALGPNECAMYVSLAVGLFMGPPDGRRVLRDARDPVLTGARFAVSVIDKYLSTRINRDALRDTRTATMSDRVEQYHPAAVSVGIYQVQELCGLYRP